MKDHQHERVVFLVDKIDDEESLWVLISSIAMHYNAMPSTVPVIRSPQQWEIVYQCAFSGTLASLLGALEEISGKFRSADDVR